MTDTTLTYKCPKCDKECFELISRLKNSNTLACSSCNYSFSEAEMGTIKAAIADVEKGVSNLQRDLRKIKNFKQIRA